MTDITRRLLGLFFIGLAFGMLILGASKSDSILGSRLDRIPLYGRIGCSLAAVLAIFVTLLLLSLFWLGGFSGPPMIVCNTDHRLLAVSRLGDRVTYENETCDGFGGSEFVTIRLIEAHGGNQGIVFSYEPENTGYPDGKGGTIWLATSEPVASWLDDDTVRIDINDVTNIHSQQRHLGRDRVVYHIQNHAPVK